VELNSMMLKARQRDLRDVLPDALGLRTHRAISWLARSEQEKRDPDARFIFLWIAFNAAYANRVQDRQPYRETRLFLQFLERLVGADRNKLLYELLWREFPRSIRTLFGNRYVYQPFWDYHNGQLSEAEWRRRFAASKRAANRALGRQDSARVLAEILRRLYTLRNQLIHGGATWKSSVNREQLKDGARILGLLVPAVILLMLEDENRSWGDPCYPLVDA
jgi:hypothetical protein